MRVAVGAAAGALVTLAVLAYAARRVFGPWPEG